jgi:hypothetical protein
VTRSLEIPEDGSPDWDALYRVRGSVDMIEHRPVMTGDVFKDVELYGPTAERTPRKRTVVVLQHPCAIRNGAVHVVENVLVAEVKKHNLISLQEWAGYGKLMPLPALYPDLDTSHRDQAALFDSMYLAHRDQLNIRVACLSLYGVNLLMHRWIHHCSRALISTSDLNDVVLPAFEEVDLIEDWLTDAIGMGRGQADAERDVDTWLNSDFRGTSRRRAIEDGRFRAEVRRDARSSVQTWIAPATES